MPSYIFGARAHDYKRGTPLEIFKMLQADNWQCTQLAYQKAISTISHSNDVTMPLIEETLAASKETGIQIPVLGVYKELASANEEFRNAQAQEFISQMPFCKALGSLCMGTETTSMNSQPSNTTLKQAQAQLYKSLEQILPHAESHNVTVGIEPVWHHALGTVEFTHEVIKNMQSKALKVIFDPANILSFELMNKQQALYEKAIDLWGTEIVAIHFKGIRYDGTTRSACGLQQSQVDYAAMFNCLSNLPQSVLPVLREEAVPAMAAQDLEFMQSFTNNK